MGLMFYFVPKRITSMKPGKMIAATGSWKIWLILKCLHFSGKEFFIPVAKQRCNTESTSGISDVKCVVAK